MTVNNIISTIRTLLKENSRSTSYSDEFIFELFITKRALLLHQRLGKFQAINESSYMTFCMDLELTNANSCSPLDCPIKKSIFKVPSMITGRNVTSLKVMTLDNKIISETSVQDVILNQLNDIKRDKISYSMVNNFIYIWNNLTIKHIKVKAIWESILDWSEIQSTSNCIDVYSVDIGLERVLKDVAIQMVYDDIIKSNTLKEDNSNDSSTEIR
jgi:hypothetical protein